MQLAFEEQTHQTLNPLTGTQIAAQQLDFSQGFLQQTGRPLDVAVSGDGFFMVQDGEDTLYTRSGKLFRTPEGNLINGDNMPVLSDGGAPLTIDPQISASEIVIGPDGTITTGANQLGKLGFVEFANNQRLTPHGQVYFKAPDDMPGTAATGQVMQGQLELANANPVTELINLIVTTRMFEAAQRSMRTISETVQQHYRS
ncbi:MAG: flagellar hook basal-body protein [Pirellulaceae bacterium]